MSGGAPASKDDSDPEVDSPRSPRNEKPPRRMRRTPRSNRTAAFLGLYSVEAPPPNGEENRHRLLPALGGGARIAYHAGLAYRLCTAFPRLLDGFDSRIPLSTRPPPVRGSFHSDAVVPT